MIQSLILLLSIIIICVASNYILSATNTQIKYSICDRKLTEAFRGIAILLIMTQHLAGHLGTNIFTPFGGIGVAIFLVLSGFGLNESFKKNGINGFLTRKFYRIWLPFFLFYIFIYVIGPFVTLCGVLSYELYLVHMQMLSNVGTHAISALMIIQLSLLISYSMHYAILFLQKKL